jgi:hypothetical protein
MMKKQYSVDFQLRYEGLPEWKTYKDYLSLELIIIRFKVKRTNDLIPRATVEIVYDNNNSNRNPKKIIKGVEYKVYKEASKYLTTGEREELNKQWKNAKLDNNILKDLFLTKDIEPKDVVGNKGLSTLYKNLKGDLQLTRTKAEEYADAIGIDPASLMFNPLQIPSWSNVNLTNGRCFVPDQFETHVIPRELYRPDLKAIKIVGPEESTYNGWIAYYYEADNVSDKALNKLCFVREHIKEGVEVNPGDYSIDEYHYYFGIYQMYGTKKRIINIDPTAEQQIIKEDVKPDVVAVIQEFSNPHALEADKLVFKNPKNAQKLGQLIREEEKNTIEISKLEALARETNKNHDKSKKHLEEAEKVMQRILKEKEMIRFKLEQELNQARKDIDLFRKNEGFFNNVLNFKDKESA